jgi:hypothetical protein
MTNAIKIILIGLLAFALPSNAAIFPALETETLDALDQLETLKPEKLQPLEGKVVIVTFLRLGALLAK